MAEDFMPKTDTGKLNFSQNFSTELPNVASIVGITNQQVSDMQAANNAGHQGYGGYQTAKAVARAARVAKDTAIDTMVQMIRALARIVRASPNVTEQILAQLGLTETDTTQTSQDANIQDITYIYEFKQSPLHHTFRYANTQTPDSKARPEWAVGANVYLKIDGNKPMGKSGMMLVAFKKAAPFIYEFDPADVGKTAWWVVCYTDGEKETLPAEAYGATITG